MSIIIWSVFASPANYVLISEVEYDAIQSWTDTDYEWIELFNPTQNIINLSWWTLQDNVDGPYIFNNTASIYPWQYFLLVNSWAWFAINYPLISPNYIIKPSVLIWLRLANTTDFLLLKDSSGNLIDEVYRNTWAWSAVKTSPSDSGKSICRWNSVDTNLPSDRQNNCSTTPWSWTLQYVVSLTFSWTQHTTGSLPVLMTGVYYPAAPASSSWLVIPGAWTMERPGYVLSWWNTQVDGSGSGYVIWSTFLVQSWNSVLFAQRLPIAYAVAFDVNNWTGTMNNQLFIYDTAQNLTGNLFTRVWYTFSWWNTQADGSWTGYTDNSNVLNLTTTSGWIINLYAQRTLNTYLVTFVDRDSTVLSTGMVDHGSGATAPANPTRTGYTFSGWNSDFSIITWVTIVTGEYTINQYTITFDTDGGTIIASITDDYGTGIIAPVNPTKTGYTFSGWVPTIPATMPAMDVTVTGQWNINSYTLSYTWWWADGWSAPMSQTGDYNSSIVLAANTFTRTGYTFSGWDCGMVWSWYTITMDTECTAQWELNQYLVTFEDWDTTVLSTWLVNHWSGATAPSDPTRTGYTFSWWDMDFTNITGTKTITSQYTINQYGITFNSDGWTPITPIIGDYNSAITAPTNPTKTGYTFAGWSPVLPTTIPATNTTVTAQWTINYYTLSYVAWTWGVVVWSGMQSVPYLWTWTSVTVQAQTWYRFIWWSDTKTQPTRIDWWLTWNRMVTAQFILIPSSWLPSSITPQTEPSAPTPIPTQDQPKTDDNEDFSLPLTESDKTRLLNPSFTQSCFDYKDEKTIDQWVKVSETFIDAHQLFYSYSLTKRQWTKDYRPFSTITREEAARFFVEFAKNVLCRKPNYTYTAQFSDINESDDTLASFIKASYEFGIFHGDWWKSLSSEQSRTFRPKALMTQDELAAVIVRLVTNEYDETTGDDRSNAYKIFLKNYAKTQLNSSKRDNIAEVVYDVYRWNEYTLEDIGYVIKK